MTSGAAPRALSEGEAATEGDSPYEDRIRVGLR